MSMKDMRKKNIQQPIHEVIESLPSLFPLAPDAEPVLLPRSRLPWPQCQAARPVGSPLWILECKPMINIDKPSIC